MTVPYTPIKPVTVASLANGGVASLPALVQSPQGIIPNPAISQNQVGEVSTNFIVFLIKNIDLNFLNLENCLCFIHKIG